MHIDLIMYKIYFASSSELLHVLDFLQKFQLRTGNSLG